MNSRIIFTSLKENEGFQINIKDKTLLHRMVLQMINMWGHNNQMFVKITFAKFFLNEYYQLVRCSLN